MLAVFPDTAVTDPASSDRRDARPATVRRAVSFIDEHAHGDITVADIIAGASVTAVAYQRAFRSPSQFTTHYRRVYGVPPSQTLRTRGGRDGQGSAMADHGSVLAGRPSCGG